SHAYRPAAAAATTARASQIVRDRVTGRPPPLLLYFGAGDGQVEGAAVVQFVDLTGLAPLGWRFHAAGGQARRQDEQVDAGPPGGHLGRVGARLGRDLGRVGGGRDRALDVADRLGNHRRENERDIGVFGVGDRLAVLEELAGDLDFLRSAAAATGNQKGDERKRARGAGEGGAHG